MRFIVLTTYSITDDTPSYWVLDTDTKQIVSRQETDEQEAQAQADYLNRTISAG